MFQALGFERLGLGVIGCEWQGLGVVAPLGVIAEWAATHKFSARAVVPSVVGTRLLDARVVRTRAVAPRGMGARGVD
jgi:hypothetical protein